MKNRVISILVLLVICISLFSPTAFADAEAPAPEQEAAPVPESPVAAGDSLYLGQHWGSPIQWRVLDTAMNTGDEGLFLLSEHLIQAVGIFYSQAPNQHWQGTSAQLWCSDFCSNSFSPAEQSAIAAVSKEEEAKKVLGTEWNGTSLREEKVFFLSAQEVQKYKDQFERVAQTRDGLLSFWWLRNTAKEENYAALVAQNGKLLVSYIQESWGARPALNLSAENVVFVSDAAEASGLRDMAALGQSAGREWKLTLLDESRNFSVSAVKLLGEEVEISYQGATTGENEYISALAMDANGLPVSYGRLAKAEAANGSLRIPLSQLDIPEGGSFCLLSEQDNGPYNSDLVSAPQKLQLQLSFDPGTGSGQMTPISVDFGGSFALPECSFLAEDGKRFSHWQANGQAVTEGTVFYGNTVLTAEYVDIQAESISVDKPLLTLSLSHSIQIHAQAEPEYAADLPIRWLCDDNKTISLVDNGDGSCTVTARYPGKTVLRAVTVDGNAQTEVEVTVTGSTQRAAVSSILPVLLVLIALAALALAAFLFYRRQQQRKAWNDWSAGDYIEMPASTSEEANDAKPGEEQKDNT